MKLIDNWKAAHKWASVRLAMLAGLAVAFFTAYPNQLEVLIDAVPEQYRPLASLAVGFVVFATAAGSRVVTFKQESNHEAT